MIYLVLFSSIYASADGQKKIPIEWHPSVTNMEMLLRASAVELDFCTVHGGHSSYLTHWHKKIVIEIEWQFDKELVARVNRIKIRQKTKVDVGFFRIR